MATSPRTEADTVGIYGGSFNPIHLGHTALGAWLCDQGFVDQLWFLVSPHNPLKESHTLMSDELRLRLARLAVEGDDRLQVSDFEMHLPRPSYMAHTLAALRQSYPDKRFVLIIGADNWACFDRWYQPEDILQHHGIIIYPRTGYKVDINTLPTNVRLVNAPLYDISSTEIRNAIAAGNYQGQWLAPNVWEELKRTL